MEQTGDQVGSARAPQEQEQQEPQDQQDLQDLRKRIDGLDQELLVLLNQRAQASLDVARLKAEQGLPRLDQQREDELISSLSVANPGPLTDDDIQAIYRLLLERFRSLPVSSSDVSSSGEQGQEVE